MIGYVAHCPMSEVYCGQVSFGQLEYFLRYELFSPISVKSRVQTTDYRQKAVHTSPPCNLHRWAQKKSEICISFGKCIQLLGTEFIYKHINNDQHNYNSNKGFSSHTLSERLKNPIPMQTKPATLGLVLLHDHPLVLLYSQSCGYGIIFWTKIFQCIYTNFGCFTLLSTPEMCQDLYKSVKQPKLLKIQ